MRVKIIKNARHGKQRQVAFAIICDGIQKDRVFLVFLAGEFMAIWWNELPRERESVKREGAERERGLNLVCCRVQMFVTASGSILTFTRSNSKMRICNLRKYPYWVRFLHFYLGVFEVV